MHVTNLLSCMSFMYWQQHLGLYLVYMLCILSSGMLYPHALFLWIWSHLVSTDNVGGTRNFLGAVRRIKCPNRSWYRSSVLQYFLVQIVCGLMFRPEEWEEVTSEWSPEVGYLDLLNFEVDCNLAGSRHLLHSGFEVNMCLSNNSLQVGLFLISSSPSKITSTCHQILTLWSCFPLSLVRSLLSNSVGRTEEVLKTFPDLELIQSHLATKGLSFLIQDRRKEQKQKAAFI